MNSLRQMTRLSRRVGRVLRQYRPHGPLLYDSAENRWLNLADECDLQGLTLALLRLQRGSRLIEANLPRQVTYLRDGDHEYLEAAGQLHYLDSSALGFLQTVLEILEGEHQEDR